MDNDQIKHMVNRFLMWKLPEHFRPDCGIIYTPIRIADGRLLEPSGTNLLDATQAEAMVRHMIEGLPAARPASGEREGEIQKEKANETAETVVRMELQGSQQRIVSARPELVADHVAAVPQGVSLCADRGEAVTPSPSPTPAGESDSGGGNGVRLGRLGNLVERLRWEAQFTNAIAARSLREAADRIEQQAAEIRRLKEEKAALLIDVKSSQALQWELVARAEQAERERDEAREAAHYANGTAELAMKHRDTAEARVKKLEDRLRCGEGSDSDIIKDAKDWSLVTFGPGTRERGVIAHIRKELVEIEEAHTQELKAKEWVDVIILGIDGLWRSLPDAPVGKLVAMIIAKYAKNRARVWPDWRTMSEDKPIEHVRGIHD